MLDRYAFQDSDKGPAGWLFIGFLILGSLYLELAGVMAVRRKIKDSEWRRTADVWNWLKFALVIGLYFMATFVTLFAGVVTAFVWLRK